MQHYDFTPHGVCTRNISLDLSNDGKTIEGVEFTGGCNGNLKAIARLIEGRPVSEVIELLAGNTCGARSTSCADQLTLALSEAVQQLAPQA